MSNSEARKKRIKLLRQQGKDMTKTKKDTLEKEYEKYKKHYEND